MKADDPVDVSSPIRSVIPSLDGPVLAALAGTTAPLPLSSVHRLAGRGSLTGVRRVLLRLVGTGLVQDVPGGFVLNRDHLAAPAVEILARLHGVLVERIRAEIDRWPGEVVAAGLFGSTARRDGDERSDIDIVVLSDSDGLEDFTAGLADKVRYGVFS